MDKKVNGMGKILWINLVVVILLGVVSVGLIIKNKGIVYANENVTLSQSLQVEAVFMIIVTYLLMIIPICLSLKLVKNINNGIVFSEANIKLMKRIGFFLMVYTILIVLGINFNGDMSYNVSEYMIDSKSVLRELSNWGINFNNEVVTVITLVVIIKTMINVFVVGLRLKEESDLTV